MTVVRPLPDPTGNIRFRLQASSFIPYHRHSDDTCYDHWEKRSGRKLTEVLSHLTLYSLTSNEAESVQSDQSAQSPWMDSLFQAHVYSMSSVDNMSMARPSSRCLLVALPGRYSRSDCGFRSENSDYQTGESMMKMGIIAPVSDQPVIPTSPTISTSGAIVGKTSQPKAGRVLYTIFGYGGEGDFERADDIVARYRRP